MRKSSLTLTFWRKVNQFLIKHEESNHINSSSLYSYENSKFLVFVFSFLPLGSTTLVESRVDKVEGKIIFCSAELKSPDGKVTFVTANALFIQLDTQGKGEVDVDRMILHFRDLSC